MKFNCAVFVPFLILQLSSGAVIRYTRRKAEFSINKKHINAEGSENIIFLMMTLDKEYPRAVHSACPPHWCSLTVDSEKWEDEKLTVTYSVTLIRPVEPWMVGRLSLCWGDKNTFRKFPGGSVYYTAIVGDLKPTEAALDPFSVTLYTMFMDRGNHDDLRLRDHTDLVIPELRDQTYSLPVFVLIFHEASRHKVTCSLQRAYTAIPISLDITKRSSHVLHISQHLTRVMFKVPATSEKSGTYGVSCTGHYYYLPDNKWFPTQVEKAITLQFEQLPKIELVGQKGNTVYFPHANETGHFFMDVFSTSDIVSVDIARSDGVQRKRQSELIPEFLEHEFFQIRAKYKVNIPWVDAGITGTYTIKMRNKNGETATLKIKLHRLEEMMLLVNPTRVGVEEGASVSLQCIVLTDMPANTTIKWQINSGQELTDSEKLDITGSRSAVELTLPSTNLSHTGTYTCVADNGFQIVSEDVSLTVYPRGAPDHRRQRKATWVDRMNCDKVMDAETVDNMKMAGKITVVLIIFAALAVLAVLATVVTWKVYKTLKDKGVFEFKAPTEDPTDDAGNDDTMELLQNLETHGKTSTKSPGKQKRRDAAKSERSRKKTEEAYDEEQSFKKSPRPKAKDKKKSSKSSK